MNTLTGPTERQKEARLPLCRDLLHLVDLVEKENWTTKNVGKPESKDFTFLCMYFYYT